MTGIVHPAKTVNADEVVLWTFDRRRNWRCRSGEASFLPDGDCPTLRRRRGGSDELRTARREKLKNPKALGDMASSSRFTMPPGAAECSANTPAAAGAPPSTEANEPSSASTVMFGLSAFENTTKAPPYLWRGVKLAGSAEIPGSPPTSDYVQRAG
jgi:hypothetical protein